MKNSNMPMSREGMPTMDENSLLSEIKNSITAMQQQMQQTYARLGETEVEGTSRDGLVKVTMTATYKFKGLKIVDRKAFADSAGKFNEKEFEKRLSEALDNLSEQIQKTTQEKTLELLQGMNIPDDIRNISMDDEGSR